MFESLIRVCNNIKQIDEKKIFKEIFSDRELQEDIANLNKDQMYEQGILDIPTGSVFQYAPFTLEYKQKQAGKLGRDTRSDHITLKDTGEFYDSIKVRAEQETIIISGDMKKPDNDLEKQFPNALGLTDESIRTIQGLVLPVLQVEVRKAIFR